MKDKKFPTEDACRVFNIFVRLNPFAPLKEEKLQESSKFMYELIGRVRHSIFDISKEYFALTMTNLVEF